MVAQRRPRTPHYVTNIKELDRGNEQQLPQPDKQQKQQQLRKKSLKNNREPRGVDQVYIRLRNERLDRLEEPLMAGEQWRDIFSGEAAAPPSTLSGRWQVSAFALLGLVVVLTAIFLHMVAAENNHSDGNNNSHNNSYRSSPYNSYRRRQRHARRMYKTRKKKTDEWSDDEEDLILQTAAACGAVRLPAQVQEQVQEQEQVVVAPVLVHPPPISSTQVQPTDTAFYPYNYYYDQGNCAVPVAAAASPHAPQQEHRQRTSRSSYKEPHTPPHVGTAASSRGPYYLSASANPSYKSPSINMSGVHRRGISPGNTSTTSTVGYSSNGSHHAPSPSNAMRAIAPLSGRLRIPSTPEGKDLFPSLNHSGNRAVHAIMMHPTLPTPPEEEQLLADEHQLFAVGTGTGGVGTGGGAGGTRELRVRPLNSSNFSSFASMGDGDGDGDGDGSTGEEQQQAHNSNSNRDRRGSHDTPLSASLHYDDLLLPHSHSHSLGRTDYSQHSHSRLALHESQGSHLQTLLLSPGNYDDAATPQIGNVGRRVFSPDQAGFAMPDLHAALMPPGGNGGITQQQQQQQQQQQHSNQIPFIPALNFSQHRPFLRDPTTSDSYPPLQYAASRPPRSILLDELRIVQMETGNSTHWAVQDVSDSQDPSSESHGSFDGDDIFQNDETSVSEEEAGSDIPIPSGDPRGGIIHKRDDLTMDTNAYKSLQSNIEFDELKLEEVIGGGGFGQVWRATWFGTPVAVKVLTGSAQNQHIAKAILEEFKAEINLLKGMRHPNICLYMGACVRPPNRAIVTELAGNGSVWDALRLPLSPPYVPADGTTKGTWPIALYLPGQHGLPPSDVGAPRISAPIPPKGTWPWSLVKRVANGAARGMAYLHHGNPPVLHRDLKSANLLLDDSYTAKVCDFGLSRLKAQARSMTGNCGTVQWMAPEVLANMSYDEKADVFSYGIILWELLSRQCPYEGMTAIQCALAVLNRDKRPEIPKWCPPSFHALIKACIKKDPAERPSFSQVILALEAMEA